MAHLISLASPTVSSKLSSPLGGHVSGCLHGQVRSSPPHAKLVWRTMQREGRRGGGAVCMAESGCCGGSSSEGGGCSGGGRSKDAEAMLASAAVMRELERSYDSSPMVSSINKEIIRDVISSVPEAIPGAQQEGEKFLDISQLLAEASALSTGDLVFEDDGVML
eukprot:TRINITY_DN19999_c0_g1_i1.p1 TRINITY_DN19999_c0_g1~~TRINITY_DN19999_c0_g1_i1.p1  ORF type:complete len:164 (-),score=39.08 TRINITY_DN19999_c0_g1_i1:230-721(-)